MPRARHGVVLAGVATMIVAAALSTPPAGSAGSPTAAAPVDPLAAYGVVHSYPAGHNPDGEAEAANALLPRSGGAPANANPNVSNFLRYTKQAAALPVVASELHWKERGPVGLDMPPGFSQSGERFARVAGMGTSVATDPRNPNVVYMGDMGGLWKSTDAGAHWRNLVDGKLPRVGIGALAIDPQHPNTLYAGTGISYLTVSGDINGTGVYVSHDGGAHWSRPKQSTEGYGSNVLTVTPTAVFYGSNRGLFRMDKAHPAAGFVRVHLPTNAAGTAEDPGYLANWISDVVAKPGDPSEVTVAVGFPFGRYRLVNGDLAAQGNGLYRSTNGGRTFKRLTASGLGCKGNLTPPAPCEAVDPTASSDPLGRIRLAYGQTKGEKDVLWAAVSDAGLARSGLPAGLDTAPAAPPTNPNVTHTSFNGLFRSDDDGSSWTLKASPQTLETSENSVLAGLGPLGYGIGVQSYYNLWVATDPRQAGQVYLGLEEVFASQGNTGTSPLPGVPDPAKFTTIQRYADLCGFFLYFQNVSPTYGTQCPDAAPIVGGMSTHPDQHVGIVVRTAKGARIYTGNDGGFFRQDSHLLSQSTNPQQTGFDNQHWLAMNTLSTTQPYHAALKPDGEVIAALQDNGSLFVPASGHGITTCGGDGIYVLPTHDPDVWYCSTPNAVLYYTTDHGRTITAIPPGEVGNSGPNNAMFFSPIAIDPTDDNHLVAAGSDFFETTKGTNTTVLYDSAATGTIIATDWQKVYDAGNTKRTNPLTGKIYPWSATALAVRGPVVYGAVCGACRGAFTPPKLLAAAIVTNVKKGCTPKKASSDCWHFAKSAGLPRGWITSVVIDPKDTNTLYVSVGQQNPFEFSTSETGSAKVLVSHDGGDSFRDITGNLPRTEARGLALRGSHLIAATDVGVFQDPAGDGRWSRLGSALPSGVSIRDLYLDPSGKHLLAATYGRGTWELTFPTGSTSNNGPGSGPGTGGGGGGGPQSSGGGLANTGLTAGVPLLALLLLGTGLALRRRTRS